AAQGGGRAAVLPAQQDAEVLQGQCLVGEVDDGARVFAQQPVEQDQGALDVVLGLDEPPSADALGAAVGQGVGQPVAQLGVVGVHPQEALEQGDRLVGGRQRAAQVLGEGAVGDSPGELALDEEVRGVVAVQLAVQRQGLGVGGAGLGAGADGGGDALDVDQGVGQLPPQGGVLAALLEELL